MAQAPDDPQGNADLAANVGHMAIEPCQALEARDAGGKIDGEVKTAGGVKSLKPIEDALQDTVMIKDRVTT